MIMLILKNFQIHLNERDLLKNGSNLWKSENIINKVEITA